MTGARVLEAFDPTASSIVVETELGDVPIGNPSPLHTDGMRAVQVGSCRRRHAFATMEQHAKVATEMA